MYRIALFVFLLLGVANLYAEQSRTEWLILLTKPLLLTSLSLWFYLRNRPLRSAFSRFLLIGLVFSIGGDSLLMLVENGPQKDYFFLLGLGSFLLAQLSYAYAFLQFPRSSSGDVARRPLRALPFLLYLTGILGGLWAGIPPSMKLPVTLYALAIVTMATAAFNLRGLISREHFLGLMAGVLLFVLSDSLIAINKFSKPLPYARLWIMGTYLFGQFLIAYNASGAGAAGSKPS